MNHVRTRRRLSQHPRAPTARPPTAWPRFGSATVHEAMGRVGLLKPYMRPIYPGAQVSGTAVTVLLQPGDNWMLHVAAEQIQPGDIVVAAVTAECTDGYLRRPAGHQLHGPRRPRPGHRRRRARRARRCSEMGFPVWSRRSAAKGTIKATLGSVNIPVVCAGMLVTPGRRDRGRRRRRGRACRPPWRSTGRRSRRRARGQRRRQARASWPSGVLGLDMYKMREPLAKAGLRYID